jgi:hypothetical protein
MTRSQLVLLVRLGCVALVFFLSGCITVVSPARPIPVYMVTPILPTPTLDLTWLKIGPTSMPTGCVRVVNGTSDYISYSFKNVSYSLAPGADRVHVSTEGVWELQASQGLSREKTWSVYIKPAAECSDLVLAFE